VRLACEIVRGRGAAFRRHGYATVRWHRWRGESGYGVLFGVLILLWRPKPALRAAIEPSGGSASRIINQMAKIGMLINARRRLIAVLLAPRLKHRLSRRLKCNQASSRSNETLIVNGAAIK
jgi:hypothetical protein